MAREQKDGYAGGNGISHETILHAKATTETLRKLSRAGWVAADAVSRPSPPYTIEVYDGGVVRWKILVRMTRKHTAKKGYRFKLRLGAKSPRQCHCPGEDEDEKPEPKKPKPPIRVTTKHVDYLAFYLQDIDTVVFVSVKSIGKKKPGCDPDNPVWEAPASLTIWSLTHKDTLSSKRKVWVDDCLIFQPPGCKPPGYRQTPVPTTEDGKRINVLGQKMLEFLRQQVSRHCRQAR